MPFIIDDEEEINLDEEWSNIVIPDKNMYISDENKAVELMTELIKNESNLSKHKQKQIETKINRLFSMFSDVTIENEMLYYERFCDLCSRLSERQKIKKIQDKVVISFGGKVSAGKSMFINTISGIGNKLPVNQETTTAIPTYIIKSTEDNIIANSVYGYSTQISSEALNAMAHEFNTVYGIGFPAFVDSIIIETEKYMLKDKIALLDTPGYTKFDVSSNSKNNITDRKKAHEQISVSDYLIWLIDIDSGAITEDDIQFIESLRIKTPILIVFTKSDLKTEKELEQIIDVAKKTIEKTTINCFGITAYSSTTKKEYVANLITDFLDYTISSNVRNSDIIGEFENVENQMRNSIKKAITTSKDTEHKLFNYISKSNTIMQISSLAKIWGKAKQDGYILNNLLKQYEIMISDINKDINEFFEEGEEIR